MSYVTANLDVHQRVMESFFGAGGLQTPIVDVYGEYRKCKRPWGTNNPSLLGTCVTCKGKGYVTHLHILYLKWFSFWYRNYIWNDFNSDIEIILTSNLFIIIFLFPSNFITFMRNGHDHPTVTSFIETTFRHKYHSIFNTS